ncbi:MAG: Lrp/AsnC family transcriptional regulator [Alphaproteobacteria bacterium]
MQGLDDRDIKILTILQADGRITKAALAERVNLSPTACWERLQRLEKAGLIIGFEARLNPQLLEGTAEIMMSVELESHQTQDFRAFEEGVAQIPEVVDCWAVGGGIDYFVRIVAKDIKAYQTLVDEILGAGLGVKRYFTYVVTKSVKHGPIPLARID